MTTNNSWLTILEQDTYWVPKNGWDRYVTGTPVKELIPGTECLELTDMEPEYLRRLPAFVLERYIVSISDDIGNDASRRDIGRVGAWNELIERPLMRAVLHIMATDGYVTWPDEYVLRFTADVTQAALTTIGAAKHKPFDPNGQLPTPDEIDGILRTSTTKLHVKVLRAMKALKSAQLTDALTIAGAGEAAWIHLTNTALMAGDFLPNDMRRVFLADAFHPTKVIEATQLVAT